MPWWGWMIIGALLLGSELLGVEALDPLARNGRLVPFLEEHGLLDELGGWLGQAMSIRGQKLVCYHKNWIYFANRFGLEIAGYAEPKPGIPPTPRHVETIIELIRDRGIEVILSANYFNPAKPQAIADRTGARVVTVPLYSTGESGIADYERLMDAWIGRLVEAFRETEG